MNKLGDLFRSCFFRSLRMRLVLLTIAAVAAGWLITAAVTWNAARHELAEVLWDHPAEDRQEIAGEIAEHLVQPLLIALPGLALLLALAIGIALRPLHKLTRDIAQRAPDRLDPLALAHAPTEVEPLVRRLNELFGEITRALDNERRFTADAAHELRTPLAAISAQAQVAQRARAPDEQAHALAQLSLSAQRAGHLIEQLLLLARIDSGQTLPSASLQDCRLDKLLIDTAAQHGPAAIEKDLQLEIVETQAAPLRGDPALLATLLRNLIDNAVRYTPHAGKVELALAVNATEVVLSVRDSGPGIPAAQRAEATQRFVRFAGQTHAGSGLGLAIVQRIAHVHGASLMLTEGLPRSVSLGNDDSHGSQGSYSSPAAYGLAVSVSFPRV